MKKTSIIMPVKDNPIITRVCVDSLKSYTRDYQLIIVDDGSREEMKRTLKIGRSSGEYDLIRNDKSFGWCEAINQGLLLLKHNAEETPYVVFTNNDVVFTPGWAEKMIKHFEEHNDLGVLSPVTNKVDGLQSIDYNKEGVNFQYADSLAFFCVMIKYETIIKVGGLDAETFGLGGQDDADFCIRAQKEGYKIGIARDTYIYHYGSATFRKEFKNDVKKSKEFADEKTKALENKYKTPGLIQPPLPPENPVRPSERNEDKTFPSQSMFGGPKTGKKKIFIAIPNGGKIVPGLVAGLLHWTHDDRYIVRVHTPTGIFPLDAARSRCIKEFLETDSDYLWWIDDDIVPPVDAMHKLVLADKDAIGAVCFSMKNGDNGEYFPYPVTLRLNEDKRYMAYYGQGIEEVDATGGACVMVKRKLYETIERPYEFVYHRDGTLALTCDFRIWEKAKEKGFKLFIDFSLLCDHQKVCSIKGVQDLMGSIGRK